MTRLFQVRQKVIVDLVCMWINAGYRSVIQHTNEQERDEGGVREVKLVWLVSE